MWCGMLSCIFVILSSINKSHSAVFRSLIVAYYLSHECFLIIFRLNLEWKYFSVWKWKTEFSQNAREMERMALLHRDHCLLTDCLQLWRSRCQERLKDIHNWVCILTVYSMFYLGMSYWRWWARIKNNNNTPLPWSVWWSVIKGWGQATGWGQCFVFPSSALTLLARWQEGHLVH